MINYASRWKKLVNFHQIAYNDFVSMNISKAIYSRKVDGMLGAFVYKQGKKGFFQTTTGKEIRDVPAITEYEVLLNKLKVKSAVIIGELVAQKSGIILPFNTTQSIVKTSYKPENKDLVNHYAVDVYSIDNRLYTYNHALSFLFKNIGLIGLPHIHIPKTDEGNLDKFRKMYLEIKENPGYDGIVVRGYGTKNYKVKFIDTVDVVIIGAGNENMRAWAKKEVSYLLTAFLDKDGLYRSSSKIGTGFTTNDRKSFFNYILKHKLYMKNGEIFIQPQLIVELKYFRYRITDTPSYNFSNKMYKNEGNKKSVTFSHPSFVRLRPDKKVDKQDLRLEQVPEFKY